MAERIELATPDDLPALASLLATCGLITAGLENPGATFWVAGKPSDPLGSVGLELFGRAAVLRSLDVAPRARGRGLGKELVQLAMREARTRGVERLYLLTTTAADYFPRFGFAVYPRQAAQEVAGSVEFAGACPSSATCMRRELGPDLPVG